jgi:hypothetical protein
LVWDPVSCRYYHLVRQYITFHVEPLSFFFVFNTVRLCVIKLFLLSSSKNSRKSEKLANSFWASNRRWLSYKWTFDICFFNACKELLQLFFSVNV